MVVPCGFSVGSTGPDFPWLRVFVEGVVIVGSILLVFGLQAWWDEFQDEGVGARRARDEPADPKALLGGMER